MKARLEALTPKQAAAAAAAPATGGAPKREDCASDEEFADKKTAHAVKLALEKEKTETAQATRIRETLAAYNAQIAAGPEKYEDWDATLAAGSGAALSTDLAKECPSLLWAIASSPYAADCFYGWLKDSDKLQKLIDLYKSGPDGPDEALTAFRRYEGRVGKDAKAKEVKTEAKADVKDAKPKADDAVAAKPPKPKPSAEAQVRGGAAAPDGKPALFLPGSSTVINPAWQVWNRNRRPA